MKNIDKIESRLQSLLEIHLMKYLPGQSNKEKVAQQLAAALHSNIKVIDEQSTAPNVYVIVAHPTTMTEWRADPHLLEEFAAALQIVGAEAEINFPNKPTVTTAVDTNIAAGEIRILASFSAESIPDTQAMAADSGEQPATELVPKNAFLIIGGTRIIPLTQSVTNIGRRLDNHLVIDDPRVSRYHSQLRVIKANFVIFDLDSSGGTFVNGERTNQSILYPGDVISLAGVTIIFGQDYPSAPPVQDKTTPGTSVSSERPTAIFPSGQGNKEENE
ncbi:MAG: FhaA domain-containing protein [Chloroflexota bacterium]